MAGTIKLDGTTFLTKDSSNNFTLDVGSGGSISQGTFNGTVGNSGSVNTQDYCSVRISANQTLSHNTYVAIDFDDIEYDPNNWFNTTTYKFQPTKAGKYFVGLNVQMYSHQGLGNNEISRAFIKKNATDLNSTSVVTMATVDTRNVGRGYNFAVNMTGLVDMNGSTDYLHNMAYFVDYEGNNTGRIDHNVSQFSAIRIGS